MILKKYQEKRNFKKTPEPIAKQSKSHGNLEFVVQKHDSSHLHYDFRLELNGILKSWAIPKGPTLNPNQKHLAVMVEDHPYDYKDFEGVIPPDNYGAGTVMVWDYGTYTVPGANSRAEAEVNLKKGLEKGHITFFLNGQKLKGEFALVTLKRSKEQNAWLFIKANDLSATDKNVLNQDRSALTGRTTSEITETREKQWKSGNGEIDLSNLPIGEMPKAVKPMMATLIDKPFTQEGWLFEVKWDGYRAISQLKDKNVLIYSRNNKTLNDKFKAIEIELSKIEHDVVLDGEIVVVDNNGKPVFNLVQNYPTAGGAIIYYVFDLLYLDGHLFINQPLASRRSFLKKILPKSQKIKLSQGVERDGEEFFNIIKKQGLEGMMAKKEDSLYVERRSQNWLKIKNHLEQEAIIIGFTQGQGIRQKFGALLLAVYSFKKELQYIGSVGTGFSENDFEKLYNFLEPIKTNNLKIGNLPKIKSATLVKPKYVCEIRFQEWTNDCLVRQGVFLGLREDKEQKEVFIEKPLKKKEII